MLISCFSLFSLKNPWKILCCISVGKSTHCTTSTLVLEIHCSGPIILLACRLKREEAKITAWENLQKAKAEAAIRKLEVDSFSALYFIHQFNYILLLETAEMLRYFKEFIFKLTLILFQTLFEN